MSFPKMRWAVQQKGMLASEFRVLVILADHFNEKTGKCFPSMKTIAQEAEICERHCKRIIKQLQMKNFISVQRRFRKDGKAHKNSHLYRFAKPDAGVSSLKSSYDIPVIETRHACQLPVTLVSEKPDLGVPLTTNKESGKSESVMELAKGKPSQSFTQKQEKSKPGEKVEGGDLHSVAPTCGDTDDKPQVTSVSQIESLWKTLLRDHHKIEFCSFTAKDRGQLGQILKRVEPDTVDLTLRTVLPKWSSYLTYCESRAGAFNTPWTPQVSFFVRYLNEAVNFSLERQRRGQGPRAMYGNKVVK